ncbi:MAG: phosphatidate cytidylyltransferase [Clostridia bacterium]|nr:phosphatidate cytidylyltransferase [Clostridia bacterium]
MLKERLLSALVGIVLFFAVVLSDTVIMNLAVAFVILIALFEFYKILGFSRDKKVIVAINMIIPICFAVGKHMDTSFFRFALYVYMVLLLSAMVIKPEHIKLYDIAAAFFVTIVVCVSFIHIAMIRQMDHGLKLLWPVFVGAWTADAFAYIFGSLFGKHKLSPHVSPKKTVEGAIAGVLGGALCMLVYGAVLSYIDPLVLVQWPQLGILGLICPIIGQMGDLAASAIKREMCVKDFGNILPGHGGIMDRFDSVMFVAPAVFYFITLFPIAVWP